MNNKEKIVSIFIWGLLVAAILGVIIFYFYTEKNRVKLPVYGSIKEFVLTNQFEQPFTSDSLAGKVWVADVIFTRCAGPCPKMTEVMSDLASTYQQNEKVAFVTITTDPRHDTPKILHEYGKRFGAAGKSWHFLTGEKAAVNHAAGDSLKMVAMEKLESEQQNPNDLFIHTTVFVLVDKKGRIRGTFESLEPGFKENITRAINALLKDRS